MAQWANNLVWENNQIILAQSLPAEDQNLHAFQAGRGGCMTFLGTLCIVDAHKEKNGARFLCLQI